MGTKEEIDQMFDALERTTTETDIPVDDEQVEKPPATDAPKIDDPAPATDAPSSDGEGDTPKTSPPSTNAPVELSSIELLKQEIEELKQKISTAKGEISGVIPPKQKPPTTSAPIEERDFIGDLDLDDLSRDPKEFNKVLNKIYRDAVAEVRKAKEELSTTLPTQVTANMELQQTLKTMTDNFYNSNKDLKPFNKVVGVVFEELAGQNPDKPYNKVLEMVGEETRKRLSLPKPKSNPEPKAKDNLDDPPPLPRKKGGRVTQPKPESNPILSQIDEMNKTLHR